MIGTVCRYLFSLIPIKMHNSFPINTLLINIIGGFCIGFVVALSEKNVIISPQFLLFFKIGICGGFTTFSTFSWEALQMLERGKLFVGLSYMVLSVVLCVSAVAGAQAVINK